MGKKLKEILTSLRGLTQQPENEQNHYRFRCHGIHEFYGWNGNTSVEHSSSDISSNDLVTPRMVSVEDAEQDRKRGWSLSQLVEEIKNQKKGGRTKKKKLILKDHYLNGVCYRNSFQGKKIVEWLIQNGFEKNRGQRGETRAEYDRSRYGQSCRADRESV